MLHPFHPRHRTYIIATATEGNGAACNSTQTVLITAVGGVRSHGKGERGTGKDLGSKAGKSSKNQTRLPKSCLALMLARYKALHKSFYSSGNIFLIADFFFFSYGIYENIQ